MPWENDKSTAADPDNPTAGEQLTADEWDDHVAEGHWLPDNAQFGQNANGDPIITDPQNGGATIMRYDRIAGSWVIDALEATTFRNPAQVTRLSNSQEQTIPTGTFVEIVFDTVNKDRAGLADTQSNAIQIGSDPGFETIKLSHLGVWESDPNGINVQILRNGSTLDPHERGQFIGDIPTGGETDALTPLVKTTWIDVSDFDTFKVQVRQNSGGDINYKTFANHFEAEVR